MVIAAVCQPLADEAREQAVLGGVVVEVKRLRVELAGKGLDRGLIDRRAVDW